MEEWLEAKLLLLREKVVICNNDLVYKEYYVINGVKDGPFKARYKDHGLACECYYINGELDGEYKLFNGYGKIMEISNYRKGVKQGECRQYNSNGRIVQHLVYENGQIIGTFERGKYVSYKENTLDGQFSTSM